MKCDANPGGCQACRAKQMRCFTTDRVTGRASERGQSDRIEHEVRDLKRRLSAYVEKYGPLQSEDLEFRLSPTSNDIESPEQSSAYVLLHRGSLATNQEQIPYLHSGPINGSMVDTVGAEVDIAGFEYEEMDDYDKDVVGIFNTSKTSMVNTICAKQRIKDLDLPPEGEIIQSINVFLSQTWPYVPIVHKSSFLTLVC